MNDIITPPQLSKPPDDVSPWLAYYIGQIHNAVKNISKNQDGILKRLTTLEKNGKKSNPNPSAVTFKWLLEKLALPIIMLVAGAAAAILFGT